MSTTEAKDPFLRILVTGGCGFLGSHLCRRLVNEGHDVIALDNFFTSQKSNVKDLLDKPNFEVIRGDVTKEFFIEVDQIYNMACPASPVHYHRQNGVDIRIARIFNTYGPGMHPYDGRVVSNFIVQAIKGEDITVYGEGQQTRAFCYVDDLVDGLIRLMNQEHTIGPVNIGNPGEFTIKELAELCVKKVGSKSKIIYLPLPGDDPKQRKPDITKARKYLQWEPKVPLEKGLDFAITYFRELDLGRFKKPTKHTAHLNTDALEGDKKRQKSA